MNNHRKIMRQDKKRKSTYVKNKIFVKTEAAVGEASKDLLREYSGIGELQKSIQGLGGFMQFLIKCSKIDVPHQAFNRGSGRYSQKYSGNS